MPGSEITALGEDVRYLAFGAISGVYANVGDPTSSPIRVIILKNATDVTLEVSWDGGATTPFRLPAGSHDTVDITSNQKSGGGLFLPTNSQFQVRDIGPAASAGEFIVQCFYG